MTDSDDGRKQRPAGTSHSAQRMHDTADKLRELSTAYDDALQAMAEGQPDRAAAIVQGTSGIFEGLTREALEGCVDLARQCDQAREQLASVVAAEKQATAKALQEVRGGRKALKGYGGRSGATGRQLDRNG